MVYWILFLCTLVAWKVFFPRYKIILVSPIFRNTETKELGGWAKIAMKIPLAPFPSLTLHDGKGGIYKIRDVQWDKASKEITCQTYYDQPICKNDEEQYAHIKKCVLEGGWDFREVPAGHILSWWKEDYER